MIAALRPKPSWVCAGLIACIATALPSPWAAPAARPAAGEAAAISPGQEELFAAMLGRGTALPDTCRFATGQIERTVVRGTYDCAGAEVAIELRHPSDAPAGAVRTEKIALVAIRGTPPAGLVAALAELIRERESAFEWLIPKTVAAATRAPGCVDLAPLPSLIDPFFPGCYPLYAAVLIGIGQIMVMLLGLGYGLRRLDGRPSSPDVA